MHDIPEGSTVHGVLRRIEERYRAFVQNSSEGIWCIELDEPIDPSWPEDEQVRCAYPWAYLGIGVVGLSACQPAHENRVGIPALPTTQRRRLGVGDTSRTVSSAPAPHP